MTALPWGQTHHQQRWQSFLTARSPESTEHSLSMPLRSHTRKQSITFQSKEALDWLSERQVPNIVTSDTPPDLFLPGNLAPAANVTTPGDLREAALKVTTLGGGGVG